MTENDRNIVVSVASTAMIICYVRSLPLLKHDLRTLQLKWYSTA